MRRLNVLVVVLMLTCVPSCSIMDPDDRQALRDRINGMAPEFQMALWRMTMNGRAIDWLKWKPESDQVARLQCRWMAGGKWTEWHYQEEVLRVDRMLDCLKHEQFDVTYVM